MAVLTGREHKDAFWWLITMFLDLVLIIWVYSVCENSLSCTFTISTLKISVTFLFFLFFFFAAAGLNNSRNNFGELSIWYFLWGLTQAEALTMSGDVLELAGSDSLPNSKVSAFNVREA